MVNEPTNIDSPAGEEQPENPVGVLMLSTQASARSAVGKWSTEAPIEGATLLSNAELTELANFAIQLRDNVSRLPGNVARPDARTYLPWILDEVCAVQAVSRRSENMPRIVADIKSTWADLLSQDSVTADGLVSAAAVHCQKGSANDAIEAVVAEALSPDRLAKIAPPIDNETDGINAAVGDSLKRIGIQ